MHRDFLTTLICFALIGPGFADDLEWVQVSDDSQGFVLGESGTPFTPWGFNYDHEGDGKLLEDYWDDKWPTVESAFREMKQLGANVVRIHLQFGRFMESPNQPRQHSLNQLARLLTLAEETGLYIDLTWLGCYNKQDVPEWYGKLSEADPWAAQAAFWEAVAKTCSKSPAIFCYDLMNEPVVPGGNKKHDDWLGPGFGDKHFVQFIALERNADGVIANRAIADLRRLKDREEPFFLAVGFLKPHLPFIAPKKYWDFYDADKIQLPDNYRVPKDAPKESIHSSGEMRAYAGIPAKGPVSDETARNLIHGYYACVSYADAQIGKLLDELDRLELTDNTIVVLWGDHGWNLGEHTLWCKHSCYETSMQIPLIVRAPGIKGGQRRSGLIESIDLYPSLCDLAGLPLPDHLQGRSFATLMKDADAEWKSAAVGRFQNGDTIRTDAFRFTEYTDKNGKRTLRMLYDHSADPYENVNVAASQKNSVSQLTDELHRLMGRDEK